MSATRANVTFDSDLLDRIDAVAERMGLNRSAFLAVAVNTYFQQIEAIQAMNNVSELVSKLEDIENKLDNSKA